MSTNKHKLNMPWLSDDTAQVTIVIRPDNIALVSPLGKHLAPLKSLQKFMIEEQPGDEPFDSPGQSHCIAFPAGLLFDLEFALTENGYEVTIDDRRNSAPGLKANKKVLKDLIGKERVFLKRVLQKPLGQIHWQAWPEVHRRIQLLGALYPKARILIAEATRSGAFELQHELTALDSEGLGLVADHRKGKRPRCLVTTFAMLAHLTPGIWPIVVGIIRNQRILTRATCNAVLHQRARRVYTFVPNGLELAGPAVLWLDAMSGGVIECDSAITH